MAVEEEGAESEETEAVLSKARRLLQSGALEDEQVEPLRLKIEEIEQVQRADDPSAVADRMDELVDLLFDMEGE
jgi:hypothetical protein